MLIVSLAALAVVLTFALLRPKGWTEDIAAVPAAVTLIAIGALSLRDAVDEMARLLPVIGFLAAVLVLAELCDEEGVFRAAGKIMARSSAGRSRLLLRQVFVVASVTTAVLSLDATVVLLTPVVLATARAASTGAATQLCERPPGEHCLVAAAGVEPDQLACVREHGVVVHPVHGVDGRALANCGRRRVRHHPPLLHARLVN